MIYGHTRDYTPEEIEKIKAARRKEAIFAGYYRPKFNEACKRRQRRTRK